MKNFCHSFLPRFVARFTKDQSGQVLPWMALLMVLFLGMAGLTIDLGRAYVCYRELQASTDAAALAGAYAMTQSGATVSSSTSMACSFSANTDTSGKNPLSCNVAGGNGTGVFGIKALAEHEMVYDAADSMLLGDAKCSSCCLPGKKAVDSAEGLDRFGRKFTGHWVVKPGREVNVDC